MRKKNKGFTGARVLIKDYVVDKGEVCGWETSG